MLSGARSSMMLSVNNRESQLKKQKPERVTNLNSNDKSPAQQPVISDYGGTANSVEESRPQSTTMQNGTGSTATPTPYS